MQQQQWQDFQTGKRWLRKGFFLVLCLVLVNAGTALADEVPALYEATVPVVNQDKDNRTDAIRSAFTEVLIRVTGRSDITDAQKYPAIAQATETATRFAQQYRYVKSSPEAANSSAGLAVWVRFDETAISKLLRASHLPVWGATRPSTLIWLAVDQRGKRELLGADSNNAISSIIKDRARLRGVPLRLPLLDLTDQSNLSSSDVWGNFQNSIMQASQRYQTEAVLVGRVSQGNSDAWSARWTLYVESGREDWSIGGGSLADVLNAGIDKTAETLALRYGQVDQADTSTVLVKVRQIGGLADFNRVVKYLESVSHVRSVEPLELSAHSAMFRLSIPGGRLAVARAVSLGRVLATAAPDSEPVVSAAQDSNIQPGTTPGSAPGSNPPGAPVTASTATPVNTPQPAPHRLIADLTYRLVP